MGFDAHYHPVRGPKGFLEIVAREYEKRDPFDPDGLCSESLRLETVETLRIMNYRCAASVMTLS